MNISNKHKMLSHEEVECSIRYCDNITLYMFWKKHFLDEYEKFCEKQNLTSKSSSSNSLLNMLPLVSRCTPLLTLRKGNMFEAITNVVNGFLAESEPKPLDLLTFHILKRFTKLNEPESPFCCDTEFLTIAVDLNLTKSIKYIYKTVTSHVLDTKSLPWLINIPPEDDRFALCHVLVNLILQTNNIDLCAEIISKDIDVESIKMFIEKGSLEMIMTLVLAAKSVDDFNTKWKHAYNSVTSHSLAALKANDYVMKYYCVN